MSKSDIFTNLKYQHSKNVPLSIKNWFHYVIKKEKIDATSLNGDNYIVDYDAMMYIPSMQEEKREYLTWSYSGNIDVLQDLKENNIDRIGYLWRLMIPFPPDFALSHGLITKKDFYELTKQIMPSLISDMDLKLGNIKWYAGLHRNTKNPHMHILIYEIKNTVNTGRYSKKVIYNLRSNIANYLIDNEKFYKMRDQQFQTITGTIDLKQLTRTKKQKLFSDSFQKGLNEKLLSLYSILPEKGRLQYHSKNMQPYKKQLDQVIEYILLHDSVKYEYARYLKSLEQHQKELIQLYGEKSRFSIEKKYYHDQLDRLYSKIGNDILQQFKIYQSKDQMEQHKEFLKKHISEMKFKSRKDYTKQETKVAIAQGLYQLCILANTNDREIKTIMKNWLSRSQYDFDLDSILSLCTPVKKEISSQEYYRILNRLGYPFDRYQKYRNKYFYQELRFQYFMNQATEHLLYELEKEEKQIIQEMQFDLEDVK